MANFLMPWITGPAAIGGAGVPPEHFGSTFNEKEHNMARQIVEKTLMKDGEIVVKVYDDGAIRVELSTVGAFVIEQAWMTSGERKNVLISPRSVQDLEFSGDAQSWPASI